MKFHAPLATLMLLCAPLIAAELPLPDVPSDLRTPALRADYIGIHFWDDMDFGDSSALSDTAMAQNVANFLSIFPLMSSDSTRREAAAYAVKAAKATEASAALMSQTIEDYLYAGSSPMRDEKLYSIFLEEMLTAAYPDSIRTQWMLEMTAKNAVGTMATDFSFTDRKGRQLTLHSCLGVPTILMFYDPECDLCHAAAEEMEHDIFLSTRVEQGRAAIVAIAPTDMESWKESKAAFPDSWVDGCDDGKIDDNELYLISQYPEFYLLDSDGTVLLKNRPLKEIYEVLITKY